MNYEFWARVYRNLNHKDLVDRSKEARKINISPEINAFADAIVSLQAARNGADYDPVYVVNKEIALGLIDTADGAIAKFEAATLQARQSYLAVILSKQIA